MNRRRTFDPRWLVLFSLSIAASRCVAEDHGLPPGTLSAAEARFTSIARRMSEYVAEGQAAGMVNLVAGDGKVVYLGAVGMADLEAERPMQPDTVFAIASMTKPIAATALMILRDEGRVALDDPVAKYLPEFVRVKLQGQPFEQFLDQRIFQPLGMNDTTFNPDKTQQRRLARLYKPGALETTTHWINDLSANRAPNPSGGLFSTAADMARFYQMILDGGRFGDQRIVSADSVREMTRCQTGFGNSDAADLRRDFQQLAVDAIVE